MTNNFNEKFRDNERQDQVLDAVSALLLAVERQPAVLNFARYRQMAFAHAILQKLARDAGDMTLTYKLHQPFKFMGSVSLEGESLEFCNSPLFSRAAGLADNIEIYPLVNGRVRMTFTFHGLTTPIGGSKNE